MSIRYGVAFCVLFSLNLSAEFENSIELGVLKEEFNLCRHWHHRITWKEFLKIRNKLRWEGLVKYVDKIEQQKMAKEVGLEVPKTYIASRDKVPFIDIISGLPSYVAKMTHMSLSQGLIIVKDGVNMVTGKPISPEQVQESVYKFLEKKPRKVESWALHQVQPGFMIQEYIPDRLEVKIQTIFGRAVIGEWRGGESNTKTTNVWGRYNRYGNRLDSSGKAPEWWPKAIAAAELMAKGSDALRVDFLVRENGELLLNELEIWPESNWAWMETALENQLNDGYRNMCEVATSSKKLADTISFEELLLPSLPYASIDLC